MKKNTDRKARIFAKYAEIKKTSYGKRRIFTPREVNELDEAFLAGTWTTIKEAHEALARKFGVSVPTVRAVLRRTGAYNNEVESE